MSPPNQGFKTNKSLSATDASGALALISACGASRGGGIQLSGTWVGTVQFEQTLDSGTTWIAKTVYPALGGAGVTSATANGQWKFACGGETHVRVRCSAFTSGTIVVDLNLTAGVDTGTGPGTTSTAAPTATGTITSVAGSGSDGTILAANTARKGAAIFNDSAAVLYLALASTTSSATNYTVQLAPSGYYEVPLSRDGTVYTGVIKGIWASATGNARVTELS